MPKTDTREQILEYIKQHNLVRIKQLHDSFSLSPQIIHRHVKILLTEGKIVKKGSPPKTYYLPAPKKNSFVLEIDDPEEVLKRNWLTILPDGTRLNGKVGFTAWCEQRGFDPLKKLQEYRNVRDKYNPYKKEGLIDATQKFRDTFPDEDLNKVFYLDFFSYEIFGRTKWGQLVLHAKLSEDSRLMEEIFTWARPQIEDLIQQYQIDCIGYIPHSLKRKNPFLPRLKAFLHISLPELHLQKIPGDVIIAQKTLKKSADRVQNARETIFLHPDALDHRNQKLLLIDDAVGSGATLHETAKKCKQAGFHEVFGLALVGSIKGFEVIAEI